MTYTQTKTRAGEPSEAFEYEVFVTPRASWRRSLLLMTPIILISLIHLLALI